ADGVPGRGLFGRRGAGRTRADRIDQPRRYGACAGNVLRTGATARDSGRGRSAMNSAILALNIGSSSIKLALFDAGTLAPILRGNVTDVGRDARATFTSRGQTTVSER